MWPRHGEGRRPDFTVNRNSTNGRSEDEPLPGRRRLNHYDADVIGTASPTEPPAEPITPSPGETLFETLCLTNYFTRQISHSLHVNVEIQVHVIAQM